MTLRDWQERAIPHLQHLLDTCENTDEVCLSCDEIKRLLDKRVIRESRLTGSVA